MPSRIFLKSISCTLRSVHTLNGLKCVSKSGVKLFCSQTNLEIDHQVTTLDEARRFMTDCLKAVGTPQDHAEIVADNLVEADYRGHYSHGMNRLEFYIQDIERGLCDAKAKPTVLKESVATALCNGNNGLGAVIGKICMDIAIAKACTAGIGIVSSNGSNHYGIAGMYALQAIKKGYIGFSCTNTSPLMTPTRAKEPAIGTNPISLGAPAKCGDSFVLDMATTTVALGKIELSSRKGIPLPDGWALDNEGKVENDPHKAFKYRKLLPLGGSEVNSGYKGYGLGVFVEILCGMLSGSTFGPDIRNWSKHESPANLGQCFIAINPNNFAEGFEERMTQFLNYLRNLTPSNPQESVLVAGDPERLHMEKVKLDGGLKYVKNQLETNLKLAKKLGVTPMGTN